MKNKIREPNDWKPICSFYIKSNNISDLAPQWAVGGFEEFLNIMNFYVFLIVWDNRVNKL